MDGLRDPYHEVLTGGDEETVHMAEFDSPNFGSGGRVMELHERHLLLAFQVPDERILLLRVRATDQIPRIGSKVDHRRNRVSRRIELSGHSDGNES